MNLTMNLKTKIIAATVAAVVVFVFVANFIWQKTDAVIIDNQHHFTHEDITKLYEVEMQLGDIIGKSVVKEKTDVLYSLVISSIQKSILNKNNINIKKDRAIEFVEKNHQNFKGFYDKFKQQMGEESYYQLLIEPVAIDQTFRIFYNAVEPAKKNATVALKIAQDEGLSVAENKLNQKAVELDVSKFDDLKEKFLEFKKKDIKNIIYPKLIRIGDNIAVFDLDFSKSVMSVKALVFEIVPYRIFLTQLFKDISIKFPILSVYNLEDIHNKKGSILK